MIQSQARNSTIMMCMCAHAPTHTYTDTVRLYNFITENLLNYTLQCEDSMPFFLCIKWSLKLYVKNYEEHFKPRGTASSQRSKGWGGGGGQSVQCPSMPCQIDTLQIHFTDIALTGFWRRKPLARNFPSQRGLFLSWHGGSERAHSFFLSFSLNLNVFILTKAATKSPSRFHSTWWLSVGLLLGTASSQTAIT